MIMAHRDPPQVAPPPSPALPSKAVAGCAHVSCMWRDSLMCDMTHSYAWQNPFIFVTFAHSYLNHLYVWHDVFRCELCSCLQMCASHIVHGSWMWRDSMTYETRLILMCDRTHLCVRVISYMVRGCDATHSYVWQDSFICVTWRIPMWIVQLPADMCESYRTWFVEVTRLNDIWDTTHSYVW